MSLSRYRESRTLVRRPCRLPGEDRADYKAKIARLHGHFEQFNVDVSELCQWLMGLRKAWLADDPDKASKNPAGFGTLGDFLLEPSLDGSGVDEAQRDRWRRAVFDDLGGMRPLDGTRRIPIPDALRETMRHERERITSLVDVARKPGGKPTTLTRLLDRLRGLEPEHRLVLLKSAAEWVVARYRRGVENWVRQHQEWRNEKDRWEKAHAQLTPEIREKYTNVFKQLNPTHSDPPEALLRKLPSDQPEAPARAIAQSASESPDSARANAAHGTDTDPKLGVRNKRPRICPYERLKQNIDNCCYAGQKGHGPLCWKYVEFVKARKTKTNDKFNDKKFAEDAADFLKHRDGGIQRDVVLREMFPNEKAFQQRFSDNWTAYLATMGLNEQTVIDQGRLPHCLKIGNTFEKTECQFNPHTELCKQYHRALTNPANGFDDAMLLLDPLYREWRSKYLAGPSKPSFKYPSSDTLPMPKIFGAGFHEIDFDRSVVRLRLDDTHQGEWLELGFAPWPRDYKPSRDEIRQPGRVTSVHVHFVGSRARIGFRFDAPRAPSRFGCTQDEIDELRSRKFPRQAQDQQFLDAARNLLLQSFQSNQRDNPKQSHDREFQSRESLSAVAGEGAGSFDPSPKNPLADARGSALRLLAVDLGESGACAAVYQGRKHEKDVSLAIVKINKLYTDRPDQLEPDVHGMPEASRRKFEKDDPRGVRKEHVGRHLERIAAESARITAHPARQPAVPATVTAGPHDLRGLKRHVAWMIRDWARHNASQIVAAAEKHHCDLIVFESMRGQKVPGYDKLDDKSRRDKRQLAFLAYGRVRRKVMEKAVERGMRVVTAPYFKSSRVCSTCGQIQGNDGLWRKNKKTRKFICENKGCKAKLNSDANAARVLARVFWGEIVLPKPGP